jgi:DeoR-like helix-turn-helix domain
MFARKQALLHMERIWSHMFAPECQQRIVASVQERGRVEVSLPAEDFGVTQGTVRGDLSALERAGVLRRAVHCPPKVCPSSSSARAVTLTIRSWSAAAVESPFASPGSTNQVGEIAAPGPEVVRA